MKRAKKVGDGVEMLIMSIMGRNSKDNKDKGVGLRSADMGPLWGEVELEGSVWK